ncbi:MAG: hypothetical protein ACI9P7_000026 [Candidatus Azotimanducaceae bacterium]|jgi:hypothetical protein
MFSLLKWLFLFLVLSICALPFLLLESEPRIVNEVAMDAAKIDQAKAFLSRTDPRSLKPGEITTRWIDEHEISLAANYMLTQISEGGVALELHPGYAYGQLSIMLPDNPIGRALNSTLILSQSSGVVFIESLSIGSVTIPGALAEPLRRFAHERLLSVPEYKAAIASLNGLQLLEDRMLVVFQWNPDLLDQLKDSGRELLVDEDMRQRLLAYSAQIRQVAPTLARTSSLADLTGPIFILAQARGGDPVEENRAALLALSFYFSGVDIARMLGVQLETSSDTLSKKLTLSGRYDFAQHFLTSAALTVMSSSSGFADSIGLFKELDDAGGGSGFSFTDIAADRAGVIVAETAVRNAASARFVQDFFSGSPADDSFMPYALDLPELMANDDFKRNYGGIDDPRYQKVIDDIESRLAGTKFSVGRPR